MKLSATTLALTILLAAMPAAGQRHKISEINAETEEGKILQAIATEESAGRKQAMMDHFIERWPKHEAFGWVLSQLQQTQLKAGDFDKAIDSGTKLIALDPADVEAAYAGLKAAEGKKDSAAILKWGVATSEAAKKAIAEPKRAEESAEDHATAATQAKQSAVYAEYALSATALGSTDAAMVIQFTEALEKQNVKSQYFPPLLAKYAWAARQANVIPAAVDFGERVTAAGALNEDLLLVMADYYMNQKKDPDRVLVCTAKLVDYMGARPKPEGISDADWEKKKNTSLGLAYWMQGATYAGQNKHPQTDKAFRAALPLIRENEALAGPALFYLGLANYQMGKGTKASPQTAEAVKFMQQAAAVKGPFQVKAQANVTAMKKEAGIR